MAVSADGRVKLVKVIGKVILWILSILFLLCALVLSFASLLSGAMLFACAVLLNPIFIQNIGLKKGLTALLVVGLFIVSFAVFPTKDHGNDTKLAKQPDFALKERSEASSETYWTIAPEAGAPETTVRENPNNLSIYGGASAAESLAGKGASETPTSRPTTLPTPTPTMKPTPAMAPTATPTATQTPNPTPTILLLAEPSPTTSAKQIKSAGIEIIEYTDVIERGEYASIDIKGEPNTTYNCQVEYKSGKSKAKGLGNQNSDSEGYASWSWKVGTNTSLDYRPTITIRGGGDSVSARFQVVE